MKIIKKGKVVPFNCDSCGCEFVIGVKSTDNNDGNYYANCPMCGSSCHSGVNDIATYEKRQMNTSE